MNARVINQLVKIVILYRRDDTECLKQIIDALCKAGNPLAARMKNICNLDRQYERQEVEFSKNSVTMTWKEW